MASFSVAEEIAKQLEADVAILRVNTGLNMQPGAHLVLYLEANFSGIEQSIARLRDCGPTRLDLYDPHHFIAFSQALALGFKKEHHGKTPLFRYNRKEQKPVPKWLNAKYWANPEQFGRRRW